MKKLIMTGIVSVMVMGLTVGANAYMFAGSAVDSNGSNAMTNLQFGDATNSSSTQPSTVGGSVELALPGTQTWTPSETAVTPAWNYKMLVKPAPAIWTIALWADSGYAQSQARVRFWCSSLGNAGSTGTTITGQTWELKDAFGASLWKGTIAATGSEGSPLFNLLLDVTKTGTPQKNAALYTFGQSAPVITPEPGSMVAMLSGFAGLVGFGIRRRK